MQFTKAEEYGVLGTLYLAHKQRTTITPLSEIASATKIPDRFLAKIFQSLARGGVVNSHRGAHGGFTLAKEPGQISIREVIETIQGPYHLSRSIRQSDDPVQTSPEFDALTELLSIAEKQLMAVFEKHTLADLATWQQEQMVPMQ